MSRRAKRPCQKKTNLGRQWRFPHPDEDRQAAAVFDLGKFSTTKKQERETERGCHDMYIHTTATKTKKKKEKSSVCSALTKFPRENGQRQELLPPPGEAPSHRFCPFALDPNEPNERPCLYEQKKKPRKQKKKKKKMPKLAHY